MKKYYLIANVTNGTFWNHLGRRFGNFLYAEKFTDKEILLKYAQKENIGFFKIIEVYETK